MAKTISDRAQKAADTRARNAELAQMEAEQLASETKGKFNCLKLETKLLMPYRQTGEAQKKRRSKIQVFTVTWQEVLAFYTDIGAV